MSLPPLGKSLVLAGILFLLDAFLLNQGVIALVTLLVTLFAFLPKALWVVRKNKQLFRVRMARVGIYLVMAFAVFAANYLNNQMAGRRALALIQACKQFHAKHYRYPDRLEELVPQFMHSVPRAKYTFMYGEFSYYLNGDRPILWYAVFPPFGRRIYNFKSDRWGHLD